MAWASAPDDSSKKAATPLTALDVLIAYEDLATALRAKRALDLLPEKFRGDTELSTRLWRVDLLTDAFLRERAAIEAAAADVIILSLHGGKGLPESVSGWLGRWLRHKEDRPYAIGLLLDLELAGADGGNAAIVSVEQMAEAGHADLFYGFCEVPGTELEAALREISERAERSSAVLEGILRREVPPPRWGINE